MSYVYERCSCGATLNVSDSTKYAAKVPALLALWRAEHTDCVPGIVTSRATP